MSDSSSFNVPDSSVRPALLAAPELEPCALVAAPPAFRTRGTGRGPPLAGPASSGPPLAGPASGPPLAGPSAAAAFGAALPIAMTIAEDGG